METLTLYRVDAKAMPCLYFLFKSDAYIVEVNEMTVMS
jgi:hypothetical protein